MLTNKERELSDLLEYFAKGLQEKGSLVYEKAFKHKGIKSLSIVQLRYLDYLEKKPGIKPSALAEVFNVRKPTVTNVLNQIEKKGLIQKIKDENDDRSYKLYLSATAKEIYDYKKNIYRELAKYINDILSAKEKNDLVVLLDKIVNKMEE